MRFVLVLAALAVGCGATHTEPETPAGADDGIRPETTAGLYWIPYMTCPYSDCPPPAALAAYVTSGETQARRIKAALDGTLAFGLPWVIHTDELDDGGYRVVVPRRGIAIVIGTFGSRKAARVAAAKAPAIGGTRATVIDIGSAKTTHSLGDRANGVTVVERGRPVPAWSKRDVEAVEQAFENNHSEGDVVRALRQRTPLCSVNPGELFVFRMTQVKWYELAPVRCGNQPAYIEWTSSMLGHAVVVREPSGYRLFQVVAATCDSPEIRDWRYDDQGRHSQEKAPLLTAGC